MAKTPVRAPKVNAPVMVNGRHDRFVVLRVDPKSKTADLRSVSAKAEYILDHVPWTEISSLDESQNALQIVREATR